MYKPTTTAWKPPVSLLFKLSVIATAVAGVGLTTGCSSTPSKANVQKSQTGLLDANSLDSLEDLLSATDMRAVEGDRLLILKHGDVWKRMTVGFKMDTNHWDPRIEAQRGWFITRQPYIERLSARASRYLYHTVKEAERRGLPTELALLPVIESSYDPAATSSAAAAGMWQFIPSTGKIYGLRQTSMYDGRRDVVESTRAAYEFLGSLYNQFGSWELALAAYNAGPGRVQQAINRNRAAGLPTDYWSLRLPQETMNYVPRFLAVAQIIKSPQKYGVNLPPIANRPHFREVTVPAGSNLNEIASITGLSRAELYQLNPGHRGDIVDASSTLRILIPADLNPTIDARLKSLKPSSGAYWAGGVSNTSSTSVTTRTTASPIVTSTNPPPALNTTASTQSKTASTAVTTIRPAEVKTPVETAQTTTVSQTSTVPVLTTGKTPKGSDALAAFAASAVIPSAPRIPVAVTPAPNVKPVAVEPPISEEERQKLLASIPVEPNSEAQQALQKAIEPEPSQAEKDEVVKELTAIAPKGTEVVDPLDGKIKLTAIQTSQSVAAEQGTEVKVGFAYPKSVAENTAATSEEAQLNQNKNFVKTESEVVVAPPKGKRSTYTVLPGDTLAIIAAKNGVNWRDIAKWNQVDPNSTLYVGTTLYLYDAKPQVIESSITAPKSSDVSVNDKKNETRPNSYVVKPNDTLSEVASRFSVSIQDLADWNGLSTNSNLFVGQKLNLVEKKGQGAAGKQNTGAAVNANLSKIKTQSYVVKRGEYLKLIADRYALSNQELASLTPGLKPESYLVVGQRINVPVDQIGNDKAKENAEKSVRAPVTDKVTAQTAYKTENYKVQSGDSLYSIAMKSNITLNELVELNNLQNNRGLFAGQTIKVPVVNKVPETYVVQSGDSLHALASKYNLGIAQVAELNGLKPNAGLYVGQKLKLNGSVEVNQAPSDRNVKTSTVASKAEKEEAYNVRSGETLAAIARKFNMQLDELLDLNGLNRQSTIRAGQRLKVKGEATLEDEPKVQAKKAVASTSKATETYTVKAGESLNVIANRLGLTAKELADMNKLNPRAGLQRGQVLQIPKLVTEYKVKTGDSLIRIASRYGIETDQLAEMNDLKSNASLQVGDILKVPN